MVMGGDSCLKVVGSNPDTVYWMDIFSHVLAARIWWCLLGKINDKRGWGWPILKITSKSCCIFGAVKAWDNKSLYSIGPWCGALDPCEFVRRRMLLASTSGDARPSMTSTMSLKTMHQTFFYLFGTFQSGKRHGVVKKCFPSTVEDKKSLQW